jgi:hypothetical protein
LREFASESKAGQGCGNGGCGAGIYFYLDRSHCFAYSNATDRYVISNVVNRALLLDKRTAEQLELEDIDIEVAHQRRLLDFQHWAEEQELHCQIQVEA